MVTDIKMTTASVAATGGGGPGGAKPPGSAPSPGQLLTFFCSTRNIFLKKCLSDNTSYVLNVMKPQIDLKN